VASDLRSGKVTSRQLVDTCLETIERFSDHNVFTLVTADDARRRADELDAAAARGQIQGPLHGIPVAVKDLMNVAGYRNTAGTGSRRDAAPAEKSAVVVQALLDAGAVLVGLTNLHEWAYGGTSDNPFFGPVRNLWDSTRMPGGSSGGSAVAVSGGMAFVALGTDTGGSVRIPASVTGTASLKITVGSLSNEGILPLTWTLDGPGPMARTVADLVTPYEVLSGRPRSSAKRRDLKHLRLGIDRRYFLEQGRIETGVYDGFTAALDQLQAAGVEVVDVSMPLLKESAAAQYAIVLGESAAVHSGPLRAQRHLYGTDVQGFLALGDTLTAQDYLAALRFRAPLFQQFAAAFDEVDFIVSPTTPHVASVIGDNEFEWPDGSTEGLLDACWRFTYPANLIGLPAVAQPCALTPEGLPVSLQLVGRPHSELELLAAGVQIEQEMGWYFAPPAVTAR
jgi:aspartyl-tRNA(Asn)/glutamyl-tRNA(Gln) amidotransferase subunit A